MRDINTEAPDIVNDEGVKWWHEADITLYAFSKGLVGVRAWITERPDGYRTRLLTKGDAILSEDQTLDGLGCKIDILALAKDAK